MLALEDPALATRIEPLLQAHPRAAQIVRMNPARVSRLRPLPLRRSPAA
jgi:hypothetical protein